MRIFFFAVQIRIFFFLINVNEEILSNKLFRIIFELIELCQVIYKFVPVNCVIIWSEFEVSSMSRWSLPSRRRAVTARSCGNNYELL